MSMCTKQEGESADRFAALKFISETHRSLHDLRRAAELQAFFTTVSFYALIGAAKFTGKLEIGESHHSLFITGAWALLLAIAFLSSLYLWGLHKANTVNRRLAEKAEDQILAMLQLEKPEGTGSTLANTRVWQIAMIITLAIAVGCALTFF